MARVDRRFGVTTAERGVSQLVSVDLARARPAAPNRVIQPSAPACEGRGLGPIASVMGRVRWVAKQSEAAGSPLTPTLSAPRAALREKGLLHEARQQR